MYEQSFQFWDTAIVAIVVIGAGFYMYRRIFRKKNSCGSGCDSCSSAPPKKKSRPSCPWKTTATLKRDLA